MNHAEFFGEITSGRNDESLTRQFEPSAGLGATGNITLAKYKELHSHPTLTAEQMFDMLSPQYDISIQENGDVVLTATCLTSFEVASGDHYDPTTFPTRDVFTPVTIKVVITAEEFAKNIKECQVQSVKANVGDVIRGYEKIEEFQANAVAGRDNSHFSKTSKRQKLSNMTQKIQAKIQSFVTMLNNFQLPSIKVPTIHIPSNILPLLKKRAKNPETVSSPKTSKSSPPIDAERQRALKDMYSGLHILPSSKGTPLLTDAEIDKLVEKGSTKYADHNVVLNILKKSEMTSDDYTALQYIIAGAPAREEA